MKQGYRVSVFVDGKGETKDDAVNSLLLNLHEESQNIEFGSGEDCLKFKKCEIED